MPGVRATDKKQFTAAFKKDELEKIDAEARKMGITRTEFLRRAAAQFLKEWKDNKESK